MYTDRRLLPIEQPYAGPAACCSTPEAAPWTTASDTEQLSTALDEHVTRAHGTVHAVGVVICTKGGHVCMGWSWQAPTR